MSAILNVRAVLRGYRLPAEFKGALEKLLLDNVNRVHSRTRISAKPLSIRTQERRTTVICKSFEELRQNGFALQSPHSLKQKHVEYLVKLWVDAKQTGSTVENKLTHLRALCEWMNKPNLIGTLGDYVDREKHDLVRSYVAQRDRSWEGNGIDAEEKISEIAVINPNVAVQLKLQAAFGLRVEESFLLRPAEAMRDDGLLSVTRGTKGGRDRLVPIEFKLAVLEEAAALSNPYSGSTIPHGYTKQQWREHYYHVLKKHGVTQAGIGVTSHGLRHQFLQQMYERITGVGAPIKLPAERVDREAHKAAMQRVVAAAGHSRATKANAYLSTHAALAVKKTSSLTREMALEAVATAGGVKSRAAAAMGISRQALYRLLEK
ncbi:integrase domain-containing protein [Paraburkholderia dilworthii]|uniref:integrase domain-containing protein n=1 Tax=Paraburkholderia dilworthii TaxID=948106 RepID=UPI000482388A|nr:integrase domain-containing protein [Paraburkholderia dilworthii]